jgi:hypothetical protein
MEVRWHDAGWRGRGLHDPEKEFGTMFSECPKRPSPGVRIEANGPPFLPRILHSPQGLNSQLQHSYTNVQQSN